MKAPLAGLAFGVLAACSFRAPNVEQADGPREVDAAPGHDAPGDGALFTCDFPGVQCPGGVPLQVLACGVGGSAGPAASTAPRSRQRRRCSSARTSG